MPLPVAPYVLGAWRADGKRAGASTTTAAPEMAMRLEAEGLVVKPLVPRPSSGLLQPVEVVGFRSCFRRGQGAWLADGTSAGASIPTADPEMVMRLEAEGLVVKPLAARMRYALHLPEEAVASRSCVVCGQEFVPQTSQVKTCGRSCGGRSKGLG